MRLFLISLLLAGLILNCGGCIWPLKIAEEFRAEVIDASSENPISFADVVYLACDFHDFSCNHATLVRTKADEQGKIDIGSTRRWGFWLPAPGGIPVPNHLIAVWAPRYLAFVFAQYPDSIDWRVSSTSREDIIRALQEIPSERSTNDESLNPGRELIGRKIKLRKK
jgi:hypothetical protein